MHNGFVLTDAAGRYRLENIPSGRYYIIAGLVDLPTYYPGVSSQSGATVVTVTACGTMSNINFPMAVPVGVTVSGRVIRTPNPAVPVPAFQRVALIGAPNPLQEAPLNPDGSFSFSRVRPGTYNLLVSSAPSITQTPIVVRDQDVTGRVSVVSGHPLLNEAAIAAVRQWRYRPQILNGQPIPVITMVTVNFSFQ